MVSWLRRPRTRRDLRLSFVGAPRAKRNAANLVTSWDDIERSRERSWKRYRDTQYRGSDMEPHGVESQTALTWSDEPPDVAGWWWVEARSVVTGEPSRTIHEVDRKGEFLCINMDGHWRIVEEVEWAHPIRFAGPITEPEEPSS